MTRATQTVELKYPFDGANGAKVTQVILQEPTAGDYFVHGEPQTWIRTKDGQALVDNTETIRAYAERLIVQPDPLIAMRYMHVLDAVAVKDAICGFFLERPAAPLN